MADEPEDLGEVAVTPSVVDRPRAGREARKDAQDNGELSGDLGPAKDVGVTALEGPASEAIQERREGMRGVLASVLIGILAVLIVVLPTMLAYNRLTSAQLKVLAASVLAPFLTLVGTVLGFYFGGQTALSSQQSSPKRPKPDDGKPRAKDLRRGTERTVSPDEVQRLKARR